MKKTKEKGITLIVLVITIIILTILVGVSLNLAFDHDKIENSVDSLQSEINEQQREMQDASEIIRNRIKNPD